MKPSDLRPHPEGGRFQEAFKSSSMVSRESGQRRSALTHIYFSLEPGEVSRFHRVSSDEVWNLYRGEGLRLYSWDESGDEPNCTVLSAASENFCHVIPAGNWQAAEPLSDTVLVGCTVAPGFEYADFELIDPTTALAQQLMTLSPAMKKFIVQSYPPGF